MSHTDPASRGAGGQRGRGGPDNQRGRGGPDNQRGRGGFDNQRGRGGFDNQRGRGGSDTQRGRGGFDNQRGRGGFDNQRGRGGFDNQRGRGGFDNPRGRGGSNTQPPRSREADAIMLQKDVANASLDVTTNQVKLNVVESRQLHCYTVSYEFKENATDDRGGDWKEGAVARLLEKIENSSTDYSGAATLAVHTGQEILSPIALPEDIEWEYRLKEKLRGKGEITRVYGVRLAAAGTKQLSLPEASSWVNLILTKAALTEYGEKVGDRLVDVRKKHAHNNGIITMDAIFLKAMRVRIKDELVNVLQVDVAKSVGRDAQNSCGRLVAAQRQRRPQDYRRACDEMFTGRRVMTTYADTVLKVKEIAWGLTAGSAAGLKKNPDQTFVQYFKEKHGLDVKPDSIIFLCKHTKGGSRPIPFPADVLQPLFLDEDQTKELPFLCSIYPQERFELVNKAVSRLAQSAAVKSVLSTYGLSITPGLLTVGGGVMRAPTVYVPTRGNGFQSIDLSSAENLGQGGYASKLAGLLHPDQANPFASAFLVDPELLKRLGGKLTCYNPPLPPPTAHRVGTPEAVKDDQALRKGSAFVVVKLPDMGKEPYESYKTALARRGVVSQMVAREPQKTIPMAIAQQICAKTGCLNAVVDVGEVAPVLTAKGTKDVLIIGVDIGSSANRRDDQAHKVVREQNYTVAFVAFHARGRQWRVYSNHCQVKGGTVVLHTSGTDDDDRASSAPSEAARRPNPSEVIEKRFKEFLRDAVSKFNLGGKGGKGGKAAGSVLLYRGSPSEGEVMRSSVLHEDVKEALPGWDYAVLIAQARSHTRFGWRPPTHGSTALCNAPRGFCTFEAADTFFVDGSKKPARTFSLVGANCTLGHASNTVYIITATSGPSVSEKEVVALTYALCYLYPNKADALPLPLPMKCAAEYARKFSSLSEVQNLPDSMRQSMHYL